ncbi:hypothetical protein [Arthrobacter sp. NA-172]|uniref:hypothetical protein n=1 Tax=Arthrobacter sp. NA-172 TaxID=3367524 RepID=UPI00375401ED
MNPRDRAAAILVLVFGQQVADIVKLTWDNVTVTKENLTITLGTVEIALTPPLDEPWRELAATPTHHQTAAHPNSNWVFRGGSPGKHLQASSLTRRLSTAFSTRAARLGTLHELTKLARSPSLPRHLVTPRPRLIATPSTPRPITPNTYQISRRRRCAPGAEECHETPADHGAYFHAARIQLSHGHFPIS